jgi:hypothetical protein
MKKKSLKSFARSAFFSLRALFGLFLCCAGIMLALFASSAAPKSSSQPPDNAQASTLGPNDLRGVDAVLTAPLREMPVIRDQIGRRQVHPEPVAPPLLPNDPETEANASRQTLPGPVTSAPNPTGVSFDGVGVGLGGFSPSSNPPDVNGRVGTTQYVQWNNTSFAVFNKTTGALLYGPVAGNTLFQALGGICASHNDGDPVVSFDILASRWVLSQFAVDGPAGSASHQCVAVSQTQDATGAY